MTNFIFYFCLIRQSFMVCVGCPIVCHFEWPAKASSIVFNLINIVLCDLSHCIVLVVVLGALFLKLSNDPAIVLNLLPVK